MKKTIKLAVVAALALGATSAFATNGSNMIATGAKATGMGGVGIGVSHGAESALSNPALITSVENTEISFGGTIFMPSVSTDGGSAGMVSNDSDANLNVIPEVSIASKINDNFYMGIGMWGTAGMGVDYRNAETNFAAMDPDNGTMNMVTNLQLMQFGVPFAYKINGLSVAVTPILQYGSLDMDFTADLNGDFVPDKVGNGVSQDLKFGYNIGFAYEVSGITVGATYVSQIDMEYTGQFIEKLSTPSTLGAGISYEISGNTIALDYKQIKWEDAEGYKDFGWKNQSVMALGYQYATKDWAARLGYNYAKSPIEDAGLADGGMKNMFNLVGFPAIVQSHITVGGTYNISKQTSVDLAYVYTPEVSETFDAMAPDGLGGYVATTVETKHSQTALSFQVNYVF
ncbi:outer membrane protein transport protein [bacterium]|nr:outer membrane protein transport protein [bacterium]MBU1990263.1 outer membrane protein transport protein [bacterium]